MSLDGTALAWHATLCSTIKWKELHSGFLETFNSTIDRDFPELRMHDRKYNPLTESINTYFFEKVALCRKVDTVMPEEKLVKNVIKALPSAWGMPPILNSGLTSHTLMSVLQNVDSEARSNMVSSTTPLVTLDQVQ